MDTKVLASLAVVVALLAGMLAVSLLSSGPVIIEIPSVGEFQERAAANRTNTAGPYGDSNNGVTTASVTVPSSNVEASVTIK